MRISTIFGTVLTLAAGILIGWTVSGINRTTATLVTMLPSAPPSETYINLPKRNPELQQAERLLNASRTQDALAVLSRISPDINLTSEEGSDWLRLLVNAYASTDNQQQLIRIYNQFPQALASNEQAALAVADAMIDSQKLHDYDVIRDQWRGKERQQPRWVFLDVQQKMLEGKKDEASFLLKANKFSGKYETDRLVRLAALYVIDDPKLSWKYLSDASAIDPANPDIYTFKASVGETLRHNRAAHSDYIAAVQTDPESPFRREQLADFYLRTGQYPDAIKVLQDTMQEPSLDTIWVKALFWGSVAKPIRGQWEAKDIPEGNYKEFAAYLLSLPNGVFWEPKSFSNLPLAQYYLETRQETLWLQIIAALKSGHEMAAMSLMEQSPFKHISWQPQLEKALKTLITYRQSQREDPDQSPILSMFPREGSVDTPQKVAELLAGLSDTPKEQVAAAIPYHLKDALLSHEAFTLLFLAAGWNEAAIELHAMEQLPEQFPAWIPMTMAKALKENRGGETALSFIQAQRSSPQLALYAAEIALESGDKQMAFNNLKGIYTVDDSSGRRAALMLSQFLLDHNNPKDAKKALLAQPALANEVAAKEILARIAIQEGDMKKAYLLYLEIEDDSSEAKSFLARKAYSDKNWERARQLTSDLLETHPDNLILQENMTKIIAEQKKRMK